ncbi:hypothetical protein ACFSHQ_07850 [Gemmobacter lanyuensis]
MLATDTRHHIARIEAALQAGEAARSPIAASWSRSARMHGLDPVGHRLPPRLTAEEFGLIRERMDPTVRTAAPTLDRLFRAVGAWHLCRAVGSRRRAGGPARQCGR